MRRRSRSRDDRGALRVYVGNLPFHATWMDVKDHMRAAGDVAYATVLVKSSGRSSGAAVVEYFTASDAERAIATLNNTMILGRPIQVREDRDYRPRAR